MKEFLYVVRKSGILIPWAVFMALWISCWLGRKWADYRRAKRQKNDSISGCCQGE